MILTLLGTGNANVTKCYNTCFTLSDGKNHFLIDAGGGNGILRILEEEGISLTSIHHVFVSHGHTDHVLGIIWVIRIIGQLMHRNIYEGTLNIYCHRELKEDLVTMCRFMLAGKVLKYFDNRIQFYIIEDGMEITILGGKVRFMDLLSAKMKQYGFIFSKNQMKLTFCGDVPLQEVLEPLVQGSDWMLHEAFCLYEERDIFKPYEKQHSTVKDACELAEKLSVKNLILYHTEDTHIEERKVLYTREGAPYFTGKLYVPDDREIIEIEKKIC